MLIHFYTTTRHLLPDVEEDPPVPSQRELSVVRDLQNDMIYSSSDILCPVVVDPLGLWRRGNSELWTLLRAVHLKVGTVVRLQSRPGKQSSSSDNLPVLTGPMYESISLYWNHL